MLYAIPSGEEEKKTGTKTNNLFLRPAMTNEMKTVEAATRGKNRLNGEGHLHYF